MNASIVYGSQYGTTRRYAQRFSQMTGFPAFSCETVRDLTMYDLVIHFGGLYAGGVKGLKRTLGALGQDTRLMIVTVGLADGSDPENQANIRKAVRRQVPEARFENTPLFHLRGAIDYGKLSWKHKTMMTLLYHRAKHLPKEQQTAEVRALIETFDTAVDFVDFAALEPLFAALPRDGIH